MVKFSGGKDDISVLPCDPIRQETPRSWSMMYERIPTELEGKLKTCRSLPSPPAFALQVIELVNDPELHIDQAMKVFSLDPAIVSKILRIANSPLYANQRKVANLHMAVLLLGLTATTSLALSFSLVTGLRQEEHGATLNHSLYWKRTGLAAAASRVLGQYCELGGLEELFIAALLQDIGMLAFDHVCPDLYADPALNQYNHAQMVSHEHKRLGVSHATVGGWLLAQWQLPERLHVAVAFSEDPLQLPPDDERARLVRCVAGSGALANLLLNKGTDHTLQDTADKLEAWLGIPHDHLADILDQMQPVMAEVDHLFDMNIRSEVNPADLIDMAREGQLLQNLQVCHEIDQLKFSTVNLESQYEQLENSSQRDGLTKVFNRAFLDKYLEKAFQKSFRDGTPLSLGFIDLDHFKQVNDIYGHLVGDQVLQTVGDILLTNARTSDLVCRYGGEEFVIVLPETTATRASVFFHRILDVFRQARHDISEGQPISVTASIGVATHSHDQPFPNVRALVTAADQAMYAAKTNGRDQYMAHEGTTARVMSETSSPR